ncbi:MAG: HAMP domain-containing histidine kinase, partial [Actinomycetota bacterium]|nr:HAMP domain-containing histidine kinase [Actinomycetota bacterium]
PHDLAEAMHRIETEAARMGELVDELLLLARIDQGRPLEREPVDLGALAEEAVRVARTIEPDRRIAFQIAGDTVVRGDVARLRQVLVNLLSNIRAHTPGGTRAAVRVTGTEDAVELEVTDSGPGLSESERARVFERFYQGAGARTHGGSGLGLAIVAAVVAAHGGTVRLLPAAGTGCRFVVRIPKRNAAGAQVPTRHG